jgi:hypothetical protein
MAIKATVRRIAEAHHAGLLVRVYRHAFARYMSLKSNEEVFHKIYESNAWNDSESRSGTGSNLQATELIRVEIPKLLSELEIQSLLDAPCGDFHWMGQVDLTGIEYIGVDVVSELIASNQQKHGKFRFQKLDIITDDLPRADLILCRDALQHFPYRAIRRTISNFQRSGARYLLATTHPQSANRDVPVMSYWRPLNLQADPFRFPVPLRTIEDHFEPPYRKQLALWLLDDLKGY